MILGIMQPYFFPYLGYFDLIHYADEWIVFNTAQYIRHGWVNRNRILHPTQGWQYIIVPLQKHHRDTAIKDIKVQADPRWRDRILGQLGHYQKRAPHYRDTVALVERCLRLETDDLTQLNVHALDQVCQVLGIRFAPRIFSEMNLALGPVDGPGDWALRISEARAAAEYVNPPGGLEIFDPQAFASAGIRLTLRQMPPLAYECRGYAFTPGLSIIDVLMWNAPERVRQHLDEHRGRA